MNSHTPGPWRLTANDVVAGIGNGSLVVAHVEPRAKPTIRAADAALIAAAPSLLAFAEEAECDGLAEGINIHSPVCRRCAVLDLARGGK